ncbi:MAG: glycosyltransferase [Desulfovibrio sp.]|jgi:glycosyltransferase involved in cell wall biosynthesis|nr:glycosyltransferase [Desulfovibrio sp.]
MRILFLHTTFPGAFRLLAHTFSSQPGNKVLFLSEAGHKGVLPGVRRIRLAPPLNHASDDPAERLVVYRFRRGARAGNALLALQKDGFVPDLICASASMAGSLFVRDIFPDAYYMVQADWFSAPGKHKYLLNKIFSPTDFATARMRNLWEYNALGDCDLAITSSEWQRSQYPSFLAQNIKVVPSGINTLFFSPAPGERFVNCDLDLSGAQEIVTFADPHHDATRGFEQFMCCLPKLLQLRPACHVLFILPDRRKTIRGNNESVYGESEDLRQRHAALPLSIEAKKRVHLLGVRSVSDYRRMLRASDVHVYLTAPYALSSGLLEAMACGGIVVGSDTEPVHEVLHHGINGFLCDLQNPASMAETIAGTLSRAHRLAFIRQAARQTIVRGYNAAHQTKRLMHLLMKGMTNKKA